MYDKIGGGCFTFENRASCVLLDTLNERSMLLCNLWAPPLDARRTEAKHPELWSWQLPLVALGTKLAALSLAVPCAAVLVVLMLGL